jgi:hypothetical protein
MNLTKIIIIILISLFIATENILQKPIWAQKINRKLLNKKDIKSKKEKKNKKNKKDKKKKKSRKGKIKKGIPLTFALGFPLLDMATGAYTGYSVHQFFSHHSSKLFGKSKILRRLGLFLIDIPILTSVVVIQHEYFGHLYRAREYDIQGKMKINPPFPYNLISTKYIGSPAGLAIMEKAPPHLDGHIMMVAGGIEANQVASQLVREKYILNYKTKFVSPYYLVSRLGSMYYILLHSHGSQFQSGIAGDPLAYRLLLNEKYGKKDALKVEDIRLHSLWIMLDFLTIKGIPFVGDLLYDGKMLKLSKKTKFLPGTDYMLTPYGEEFDLQLMFINGHRFFNLTSRIVNGVQGLYGGLSLRGRRLIKSGNAFFGMQIDGWYLPKFNNGKPEVKEIPGGAIAVQAEFFASKNTSLEMEIGRKTDGYMPGRALMSEIFGLVAVNYIFQK